MINEVPLWSALTGLFMVGLMGAGHCIGMCGGITAALGFAGTEQRPKHSVLLSYNLGRIASYMLAGALVGGLGYFGEQYISLGKPLRAIAAVLLIFMGLYIAGRTSILSYLERAGGHLWRRIQPLGNRFIPVKSPVEGFLLGSVWGWLPCGLVYTALAFAVTGANPLYGALAMLAFGLGTLPAMLAGGYFSQQLKVWLQKSVLRSFMGGLLILFGVWTLWSVVFPHSGHHQTGSDPQQNAHHLHE